MKSEFLNKINKAFSELRKKGVWAKGNAGDCETCSVYSLWKEVEDMDKEIIGIAYWTKQSENDFLTYWERPLYIGFQAKNKEKKRKVLKMINKMLDKYSIPHRQQEKSLISKVEIYKDLKKDNWV
jgi:hypothetical protein